MSTTNRLVDLDDLLNKTSRTFALAIPLLPEPPRSAVGLAYLLFRIADTFEDATDWPREERLNALESFVEVLELDPATRKGVERRLVDGWLARPPVAHAGYLELLSEMPAVLAHVDALPPEVRRIIIHYTLRTTEGMASVVRRADERANLKLKSISDLKDYCYLVAGIVGELLTELFLYECSLLKSEEATLKQAMRAFGEGLQLVNILKDAGDDARDGRVYLPDNLTRAEILSLARADLKQANHYVQALQRGSAPRGYLAFTGICLMLAFASLECLEVQGGATKVSRLEVARLFEELNRQLDEGIALDLENRPRLFT